MDERAWMDRVLRAQPLPRAEQDALLQKHADLAHRYGLDSKRATRVRNKLVEHNLRLVMNVAAKLKRLPQGVDLGDLMSFGALGLNEAIRRFEPERGLALSTYAPWWIRHEMHRGLQNTGHLVRVPVHAQEAKSKSGRAVREAAEAARRVSSMDAPVDVIDNSRATYGDLLADDSGARVDDAMERDESAAFVRDAVQSLPEREREVISLRMDGLTLAQVGDRLRLSRERCRQLELQAMARIRAQVVA